MKVIDNRLIETSKLIDKHLALISDKNRAEESTEILTNVRNYCELVLYKIYDEENSADLYQTQENLTKVRTFIKSFNPRFNRFHQLFDSSSGHITFGIDQSEALMIKYVPMLISMKIYLIDHYNFHTLDFIDKYPLNLDDSLFEYYRKILYVIKMSSIGSPSKNKNLYHITKKTMRYIDNHIFFEYVLDISDDKPNKFNTVIAYSEKDIDLNYDMVFLMYSKPIIFLGVDVFINIITDYEIFIRPCSFNKICQMLNINLEIKSRSLGYLDLMKKIKSLNCTLLDIIEDKIQFTTKLDSYSAFVNEVSTFISKHKMGINLIKYLLLHMRYNVVKGQVNKHLYKDRTTLLNPYYDNLKISSGSLGFEKNPIAFSPLVERPSYEELSRLFNLNEYEHEFLYRKIETYINQNNSLFVDSNCLGYSQEEVDKLVEKFNLNLYSYYSVYKIIKVYDKYTIKFYFNSSIQVLKKVTSLSNKINKTMYHITSNNEELSKDKNKILQQAFINSSICFITGAAGTGKTRLIEEYIKLNSNKRILCLTTTNTAKNNLKRNFNQTVYYKNTSENWKLYGEIDLIVIDEAGFISTKIMAEIFETYPNSNYLIVGDPYQIESIEFGNWFKLALALFAKKKIIYNLDENHRAKTDALQKVWDAVRNIDGPNENKLLELMSAFEFAKALSTKALEISTGQVILCLNYDGLYGINNLNRYLQSNNKNRKVVYQQNTYKIGDPVVFIVNDYESFGLYNNIKGMIVDIQEKENKYIFLIQLDSNINVNLLINYEILIDSKFEKTIVTVTKDTPSFEDYDNELTYRSKLPFQLAYAMSIHKAQGLEFDKVKIIITSDTEEYISKNIFYTAITRARKNLEIYWNPEVPEKLFNNMIQETKSSNIDVLVFKRLIGEKKVEI